MNITVDKTRMLTHIFIFILIYPGNTFLPNRSKKTFYKGMDGRGHG